MTAKEHKIKLYYSEAWGLVLHPESYGHTNAHTRMNNSSRVEVFLDWLANFGKLYVINDTQTYF